MKTLTFIGGAIVIFAMLFGCAFIDGYALIVLWGWFIAPTFNAPPIGIAQAVGLTIVVGFFTSNFHRRDEEEKGFWKACVGQAVKSIGKDGMALFIGWIVHLFI